MGSSWNFSQPTLILWFVSASGHSLTGAYQTGSSDLSVLESEVDDPVVHMVDTYVVIVCLVNGNLKLLHSWGGGLMVYVHALELQLIIY